MPKSNVARPQDKISIKGARVHNLKNISVEIPRHKLVVVTGLSGSGKSSLAFDTIYAEGQRRYSESLSAYARQFLGLLDKPDVDQIEGLSPTISIEQAKSTGDNPRSTVGTATEIYDYLRLLFAYAGHPHCPRCGRRIFRQSQEQIIDQILKLPPGTKAIVLSPVIRGQRGEHRQMIGEIRKAGYVWVRFDGNICPIEEVEDMEIDKAKKHTIEVVVDRIELKKTKSKEQKIREKKQLREILKKALDLGNGMIAVKPHNSEEDLVFSQHFACLECDTYLPELEPRSFSFNSPYGACPACGGLGTKLNVDPELIIPNPKLTLAEGAVRPWSRMFANQPFHHQLLAVAARAHRVSLDTPVEEMPRKQLDVILYGTGDQTYDLDGTRATFEGVIADLEKKYKETTSEYMRKEIEQCMRVSICPKCGGKRLKEEISGVTVAGKSIAEIVNAPIDKLKPVLRELSQNYGAKGGRESLSEQEMKVAAPLLEEIKRRVSFLNDVGLEYLTLDRSMATLAGGEIQRIKLAVQIGSSLTGVIYVLDEPTIGLHPKNVEKLINVLQKLRDGGNTVIVVEHDKKVMEIADEIIDIGPGAGEYGGEIMAQGSAEQIKKSGKSLTGLYLAGKSKIAAPAKYRKGNGRKLTIQGATAFNLKNIDVDIPLGKFVCFTGVSGSGKSTLMVEILAKALAKKFYRSQDEPAEHKAILGTEYINKVINIDQSPIGRTPRSNPATYTGVFTYIRDLFTQTQESKIKNYSAGQFSFNVKEGRCEACQGEGSIKIEMPFLSDVYMECETCRGTRYNKEALSVYYREKNIADILDMSVKEAIKFFEDSSIIFEKLKILNDVGLGYIRLGQPATTLSGGEAQRIKLATELSRRATGKTLYILDEPTTGLHFEDIKRLLDVLDKLVDKGNSVLVIEHNLDVIKVADHVIDLGPEGGEGGGRVVATGTPEEVAKYSDSYTAKYLKRVLKM